MSGWATTIGDSGMVGSGPRHSDFRPEVVDCFDEAFFQRNLRLPFEHGARERDVGLPDLRIVLGKRAEDDLALAVGELDDLLRELEDRRLGRVAGDRGGT